METFFLDLVSMERISLPSKSIERAQFIPKGAARLSLICPNLGGHNIAAL